jgi:hypothetical protein
VFLVVATVVAAVLLVQPGTSLAGTQATTNACLSNATATYSDLVWTLTGTASPSPATVGSDVTLSGSSVTVAIPATLLIAGYNLGLLTTGPNSIPTTVYVARQATNASTARSGQTQAGANVVQVDNFTATVTTTITDPNGVPGTGDETATPLNVNQPLPDMVVTATGGTVAFSQGGPGALGSLPLGTGGAPVAIAGSVAAQASVAGGLVKARFDCQPGTTIISPPGGTSGTTFTPAAAAPFESVTVTAATTTTAAATTTTSGATTTTAAATTTTAAATTTTKPATTTTAAATTTTKPATTTTAAATTTTKPATTTTAAATTTTVPGPTSGSFTYDASCTNNVTPDVSTLKFVAGGSVPSSVVAGSKFVLSKQQWSVTIPGSVFQSGINLDLLAPGQVVTGTVDIAVAGSGTSETTQSVTGIPISVTVAVDGAGSAVDATVPFQPKDLTWTALSGPIGLRFSGATFSVTIGPLKVGFNCKPSATTPFVTTVGTGATVTTTTAPSGATTTVKPATTTTVATTTGSIPKTGPRQLVGQLLVALVLLDLGYLALSLLRPSKRRTLG